MNKRTLAVLACAILLVVTIAAMAMLPSKDVCSDDVRGYEYTASSSLDAVRENLRKVRASVTIEESEKVPTRLEGLGPTNFAVLKACDTQCKLLGRCLRFVFLQPPSQACPREYADYMTRTESALKLLEKLHRLEMASTEAAFKAEVLARGRRDIKQLEKSSSMDRQKILEAQVLHFEEDLWQSLSQINEQLDRMLITQATQFGPPKLRPYGRHPLWFHRETALICGVFSG